MGIPVASYYLHPGKLQESYVRRCRPQTHTPKLRSPDFKALPEEIDLYDPGITPE
jgi:hypothetical protein